MSEIKVNTISERTSANGVTIDGVNIKDSKLVTADSVVTTNITDLNVTSGKIADDAITLAKMAPGTDGNIISYDASGNPVAVATGSAGQILTSAGAGAPPTFATAAGGGTYSVHATDEYNYYTQTGGVNTADYIDIAGGNYVSFTPTSTDDYILFNHYAGTYGGNNQGANTYLMMSTSSSIGSGDTKLNYMGKQAHGGASGAEFDVAAQTYLMPCTGLTVGTTYYVEQAGSANGVGNWWYLNYGFSGASGTGRVHHVGMIHYKKS